MAKNVKQSNQKKSVLNKLGGLSKRSKFIVVVLIFAVLGGGYLTYKSFAATAGPAPVRTEAANLEFVNWNGGCNQNIATDASKNNAKVMNIYCPPKNGWYVYTKYSKTPDVFWPRGAYNICVVAKGVGSFRIYPGRSIQNHEFYGVGSAGEVTYTINSPDYKTYCSRRVTIGSSGVLFYSNQSGYVDHNYPDRTDLLTISSITRYWYSPDAAPAANGGK